MIVRLNLAINEQNEKFWYGINDKVSMGKYGKESGENGGDCREFGRVWMVGNWVIFGNLGVGSSMGGIWKKWGNVGEKWGSVLGCGVDVGGVGKYRGGCERVYGVSVEVVGESVLGCEEMWGSPAVPQHFLTTSTPPPTLPYTPHTLIFTP